VAIGLGLLLAVAAMLGPAPAASGAPGASLAIRLPDPVRTLVFVLIALSVLLLLALQRPRRPSDEDLPHAPPPVRRSIWTSVLVPLVPLALLALAWYWIANRGEAHPIEAAFTALAGLMDLIAGARKPPTSVPLFDYTIATLALLFALALFALLVVDAAGGGPRRPRGGTGAGGPAGPPCRARPARGGDPRLAALRARAGRGPAAAGALADAGRVRPRRRRPRCCAGRTGGAADRPVPGRAVQPAPDGAGRARGRLRQPGRDHRSAGTAR
jgi:hypothetical protein